MLAEMGLHLPSSSHPCDPARESNQRVLFSVNCGLCRPVTSNSNVHDSIKKGSVFQKVSRTSDGTGDLHLSCIFNLG